VEAGSCPAGAQTSPIPNKEQHPDRRDDPDGMKSSPSLRGPGFEYTTGTWFVTFVCHRRRRVLRNGPDLSEIGTVVNAAFIDVVARMDTVTLAGLVIMPDHVHAIVALRGGTTLPRVVGAMKSRATRTARSAHLLGPEVRLWQRSFYDQRITSARHLRNVHGYIARNLASL